MNSSVPGCTCWQQQVQVVVAETGQHVTTAGVDRMDPDCPVHR